MKKILQGLFINVVSLWIIDHFSSSIAFADNWALVITALVLTLFNATVKPIIKLISLPVTVLTLGLFSLIINGAVLWIAFSMNSGSYISSFGDAVWIAIILAILNSILETFVGSDKKKKG